MNRKVKCPTCGKLTEWSKDNPWRPFCSERCKLIDLGEWASEGHRIPGAPHRPLDDREDDEDPGLN